MIHKANFDFVILLVLHFDPQGFPCSMFFGEKKKTRISFYPSLSGICQLNYVNTALVIYSILPKIVDT